MAFMAMSLYSRCECNMRKNRLRLRLYRKPSVKDLMLTVMGVSVANAHTLKQPLTSQNLLEFFKLLDAGRCCKPL